MIPGLLWLILRVGVTAAVVKALLYFAILAVIVYLAARFVRGGK